MDTPEISEHARFARDVLRKAVAEALERKRRLGHYAVIVEDGKLYRLEPTGERIEITDKYPELDESSDRSGP